MAGKGQDFSAAVGRLGDEPGQWLVALDFDGTLAPIVARPEHARLDAGLVPLLWRLVAAVGTVAVISGRPRAFLETHVTGVLAVGSYGLELPPDLTPAEGPAHFDDQGARASLDRARDDLEPRLPGGTELEVKPFGLVLHYRGAGPGFNVEEAAGLMAAIARRHDLELVGGRSVLELRPRASVDKGWALDLLATRQQPSAVVFCGDDLGDVPAFVATRRLGRRIPALGVGISSPEAPAEAFSACHLVLSRREELAPFLQALAEGAERAGGIPREARPS